jgi:hypothetical protein
VIYSFISKEQFLEKFKTSQYKDNFSWKALEKLYDYYSDEDNYPHGYNLDLGEISRDWGYLTFDEVRDNYSDLKESVDNTLVKDLQRYTTAFEIGTEGNVLFMNW